MSVPWPILYFSFPHVGFCFMSMTFNAPHHEGGGHLFAESHSPRNFLQSGWRVSLQASPRVHFELLNCSAHKNVWKGSEEGAGFPPGVWGGDGQVQQKKRANIYAQHENTCCVHSTFFSKVKVLYKSIMLLSTQPSHRRPKSQVTSLWQTWEASKTKSCLNPGPFVLRTVVISSMDRGQQHLELAERGMDS